MRRIIGSPGLVTLKAYCLSPIIYFMGIKTCPPMIPLISSVCITNLVTLIGAYVFLFNLCSVFFFYTFSIVSTKNNVYKKEERKIYMFKKKFQPIVKM